MGDGNPAPTRQAAERRGHRAEAIAAGWLRLKGYRILARRFRTPVGEIDIVARRGRTIAFVEVKARSDRGSALIAVTPAARSRIVRAAAYWQAGRRLSPALSFRFDVVAVIPRRWPLHLAGAFDSHGDP